MSSTSQLRYTIHPPVYRDNTVRIPVKEKVEPSRTQIIDEVEYFDEQIDLVAKLKRRDKNQSIRKIKPYEINSLAKLTNHKYQGRYKQFNFVADSVQQIINQMLQLDKVLKLLKRKNNSGWQLSNHEVVSQYGKNFKLDFFGFKLIYKNLATIITESPAELVTELKQFRAIRKWLKKHCGNYILFPFEKITKVCISA